MRPERVLNTDIFSRNWLFIWAWGTPLQLPYANKAKFRPNMVWTLDKLSFNCTIWFCMNFWWQCILSPICFLLGYMGRRQFHDLEFSYSSKEKELTQTRWFKTAFSFGGSWYQSLSFSPANSFRSRTRSSKSSVAMSMVLIKARHVVMYGTTSAFFNSLMIKLNLYLCPLVSWVLKSEKNIEVNTNVHRRSN